MLKRKLEVIEYAKKTSNAAAANKFKVGRSSVIDWRKQEKDIWEATEYDFSVFVF